MASAIRRAKQFLRDTPATRAPILRAVSLLRRLAWAPAGLYTLCYHRIATEHRANFARQLEYFGRHGTFVSADRALDLLASGRARDGRHFLVSFDDGYADLVDVAMPVLAAARIPAIAFVVTDWLQPARTDGYMSVTDLSAWRERGMSVGSHTRSHRNLAALEVSDVQRELERSSDDIRRLIGECPRHFACPWGVPGRDFLPERDPRLAEMEGYRSFFTTRRGAAAAPDDRWQMPRHVVEPDWPLHELDALIGSHPFSAPRAVGDAGAGRAIA